MFLLFLVCLLLLPLSLPTPLALLSPSLQPINQIIVGG